MVGLCDNVANVGPVALALAGGRIVVLSHLRFAAGVCVLAAGLLMGAGGAVAVADPGSSGSAAHGDDGTNAPGHTAFRRREKAERTSLSARTPTTARLARAGNQASSIPPARKSRRTSLPVGMDTNDGSLAWLGRAIRPAAFSPARKSRRTSLLGADTQDEGGRKGSGRHRRPRVPARHGSGTWWWRRLRMWWQPVTNLVAPVSDFIALLQDISPVAGASSRSRNCPPTFFPSCWASPGRRPSWAEWQASTALGCRLPRVRRGRRDCRWSCPLPVSRACRWPATQPGLQRSM